MAASIFQEPNTYIPANQRLIFGIDTSSTITPAFRFIVVVKENGTQIGKYYLSPNPEDVSFFDLGELTRKRLEVDNRPYSGGGTLFEYTSTVFTRSLGNVASYTVEVGEWNGTTETTNQDNRTVYLIGGREQISAGLHPDFSQYYATAGTKKVWLTDYPVTGSYIELTAQDETEGYAALITRSTVSDATAISYSVTTSSGTTTTILTLNTTNGAQLPTATSPVNGFITYVSLMPVNVAAAGISLTNWISYTVYPIIEATLTPVGRAFRITKDCKTYKTDPIELAWANSKGGWDYATFEGKLLSTVTTQNKPYKKALGTWGGTAFVSNSFDAETAYFHKEGEEAYQLTGKFRQTELEVFKNLVLAKKAFIKLNQWLPVLIDTASYQVRTDNAQIAEVVFNVKLAQTLRV